MKTTGYDRLAILSTPRGAVTTTTGSFDSVLTGPIPCATEAMQLLAGYSDFIRRMPSLERPELRHLVASHVHDLMALAFGTTGDAVDVVSDHSQRAARLRTIKADIENSLARHDLSIAEVAARHRVTPRYVQLLFESEGTTYTEFVLTARLARAHRMLGDPLLADRSVTSVAFDCGFGDLSYFNRTFRRRFGCTPTQARTAVCDSRRSRRRAA